MPLTVAYTMVQESQKWPKTQIKGVLVGTKSKTRRMRSAPRIVIQEHGKVYSSELP